MIHKDQKTGKVILHKEMYTFKENYDNCIDLLFKPGHYDALYDSSFQSFLEYNKYH